MSKSLLQLSRALPALRQRAGVVIPRHSAVLLGSRRWVSFGGFRRASAPPSFSASRDLTRTTPPPTTSSSSADATLPPLPSSTRGVDLRAAVTTSDDLSSPTLILRLAPSQSIRSSPSSLLYLTPGLTVEGEGLLVDFVNTSRTEQQLALSPEYLADLETVDLRDHAGSLTIQRGSLLCAHSSVQVTDEVSRAPTADAFLGGGGFSPQRLTGEGQVVLKGGGGFYVDELLDGQTIKVTPASLVACEDTVSFSTAPLAPGPSPSLLMLTGPGRVWLQTIPPHRTLLSSLAAGNAALVPFNAAQSSALGPTSSSSSSAMSPFMGGMGGGGGMMSGLGGALATGAAMGVGSEVAHRAIGGMFGGGGGGGQAAAADPGVGGAAAAPAGGFGAGGAEQGVQGGGGDQAGYGGGQEMEGGMNNDLPQEDSGGGDGGGWFGGMFGGDNDQGGGDDDGGDWGGDEE